MEQMATVDDILASLHLQDKPVLKVFNKADRVNPNLAAVQCRNQRGVALSALDPATLPPLINRLEEKVEELARQAEWRQPEPALPEAVME